MPAFGKVTGYMSTFVVDNNDADQDPNIVPLSGKVTFQLNAARVLEPAAPTPAVRVSTPITAILDANGMLCTPAADGVTAMYQGIKLVATDDPTLNPTNLQYTVSYQLVITASNTPVVIPSHTMALPSGSTIDLSAVIPPVAAEPQGTASAIASAAIAAAYAAEMSTRLGGLSLQSITQAAYNALPSPRNSDILYVIIP